MKVSHKFALISISVVVVLLLSSYFINNYTTENDMLNEEL